MRMEYVSFLYGVNLGQKSERERKKKEVYSDSFLTQKRRASGELFAIKVGHPMENYLYNDVNAVTKSVE